MAWNGKATIFCKWFDKETKENKYTRKQLAGVHIETTKTVRVSKEGTENNDKLFLAVPLNITKGYVEPREFQKLEDPQNYFTFAEKDIVVKGLVEKDYESMIDLQKDYETFTITAVDFLDYGSKKHFEIVGE